MKRLLCILALASAAWAQTKPDDRVNTVVQLKYANPASIATLLSNFNVNLRVDDRMKAISMEGSRAAVETAEAAIKQLDVPAAAQKDVDLTVYFVVGSDEPPNAPVPPPGGPIPQELQSTVAALKQTFPFKSYGLLDALSLQSRAGSGGEASGVLSGNRTTEFGVRGISVEPEGAIRLDHLHARLRTAKVSGVAPNAKQTEYLDSGISTDIVDVKEGQKLVIGRSSLAGPQSALFLILIARVAQ